MKGSNAGKMFMFRCVISLAAAAAILPYVDSLSEDFYNETCPNVTGIVRDAILEAANNDPINLPALLRLFFHDAIVNGVDGSILLDTMEGGPKAEKDEANNLSLFGFDAVQLAKNEVEEECPGVVSCADILTLSAQIAIELTGGPIFNSTLGRRDGFTSLLEDVIAQLPLETHNMTQLVANFASKNLTQLDLVVLSGAHTIGFAHCSSFNHRLYNFNSTVEFDPSLDPTLAEQLTDVCPRNPHAFTVQPLDITTIELFDEHYYFNLLISEGILQSDQLLFDHPDTRNLVTTFAVNQASFFQNFTISMIKLGSLGVLEGEEGEIRIFCNQTNASLE